MLSQRPAERSMEVGTYSSLGWIRKTAGGNSNAPTKGGSIKTHKEGDISMRENILSQGMEIEKNRCVEDQQIVSCSCYKV